MEEVTEALKRLERTAHFVIQGGPEGYFKERADLALYLIQNSTTPDRFKSTSEFALSGQMKIVGDLTFQFSSPDDFYKLAAEFYAKRPNNRGITAERIADFMQRHQYHFERKENGLTVKNVDGLSGMLANCL